MAQRNKRNRKTNRKTNRKGGNLYKNPNVTVTNSQNRMDALRKVIEASEIAFNTDIERIAQGARLQQQEARKERQQSSRKAQNIIQNNI